MAKGYDEVRVSEKQYANISLVKLLGRQISDIEVGVHRWDHDEPSLEIERIVFADGTHLFCNGEHDVAYVNQPRKGDTFPSNAELVALYNAMNDVFEDDEDYWEYEEE